MNDIKAGEYIRTIFGEIAKVIEYKDEIVIDKEIRFHGIYRSYICEDELDFIVKHSFDLIDIIEEGDYVNGHKVIDASDTNKGCMREVYCEDDEDFGIWDEMIKTVVTKEQFENISYKVEKE